MAEKMPGRRLSYKSQKEEEAALQSLAEAAQELDVAQQELDVAQGSDEESS